MKKMTNLLELHGSVIQFIFWITRYTMSNFAVNKLQKELGVDGLVGLIQQAQEILDVMDRMKPDDVDGFEYQYYINDIEDYIWTFESDRDRTIIPSEILSAIKALLDLENTNELEVRE